LAKVEPTQWRKDVTMKARMKNAVMLFPDVLQAMLAVDKATSGIDFVTRKLVHLRASQINSCGVCVDMHARELKKAGVTDERIFAVGAWRETPYFSEAERAQRQGRSGPR
jgi:AhpD family alkylhydroperoxidase